MLTLTCLDLKFGNPALPDATWWHYLVYQFNLNCQNPCHDAVWFYSPPPPSLNLASLCYSSQDPAGQEAFVSYLQRFVVSQTGMLEYLFAVGDIEIVAHKFYIYVSSTFVQDFK